MDWIEKNFKFRWFLVLWVLFFVVLRMYHVSNREEFTEDTFKQMDNKIETIDRLIERVEDER